MNNAILRSMVFKEALPPTFVCQKVLTGKMRTAVYFPSKAADFFIIGCLLIGILYKVKLYFCFVNFTIKIHDHRLGTAAVHDSNYM